MFFINIRGQSAPGEVNMAMGLMLIVLAAELFIASALPFNPYQGAPTNSQPVYWISNPPSEQLTSYDGNLMPRISGYYRDAPSVVPAQPPTQYSPTSLLDGPTPRFPAPPTSKTSEPNTITYPLLSPSVDASFRPGLVPLVRSDVPPPNKAIPVTETSPQSSPHETITPAITDTSVMVKPKKSNLSNLTPRVSIFAPGSLISPDLIQSILEKSLEDTGAPVFIYAPGSIIVSQSEKMSSLSAFMGTHNAADSSTKLGSATKTEVEPHSELGKTDAKQGKSKQEEKELSNEDDQMEDDD